MGNVGKEKNYSNIGKFREDNRLEVHLGAGGAGKTHNNLIDKGLVNPLFIAPSWKLARNKKKEYASDSTTFFHLLDDDPAAGQKVDAAQRWLHAIELGTNICERA